MSRVNEDVEMGLGEHIDELRGRLIKSVVVLALFAIGAFMLKDSLIDLIFAPSQSDFITNRLSVMMAERLGAPQIAINQSGVELVNTKMAGQFNLHIKASIIAGFILALPFILWQVWAFVRPAIDEHLQRRCGRMVWQISLLFFVGFAFGYFLIAPLAVNFLVGYTASGAIINMIDISSYISTVINVSLAAAVIFQLPHLVLVLSSLGIVTADSMRRCRKVAIAVIVILSAVITPPDIFSQILIAIPFYALYECGIVVASRNEAAKR